MYGKKINLTAKDIVDINASEIQMFGHRCYLQTDRDTLSITNEAPHTAFWFNFYSSTKFHLYFPQEFCFGDGTSGGYVDTRCRTSYANDGFFKKFAAGPDETYYPDCTISWMGDLGVKEQAYAVKWNVWSERSKKENIQEQKVDAISKINGLKFYSYDFKGNEEIQKSKAKPQARKVGSTQTVKAQMPKTAKNIAIPAEKAQEAKIHVRMGIMTDEAPAEILSEDGKAIDLYSYVGLCASAIQELSKEVETLKTENQLLKTEIKKLKEGKINGEANQI